MFFALSKILWILLKPSNVLVVGAIIGALSRFRRLLWACLALILAAGFSPLPQYLLAPLENRFPQPDMTSNPPDGIIVLGGAFRPSLSAARGQMQINPHGERLSATAALARRFPNAKVVFTGGTWGFSDDEGSPTQLAEEYFQGAGVAADRVVFEDKARNTEENVQFSMELVNPQPGEHWVLVTSAFHMPRSMGLFQKAGWEVTPYPVDFASFPLADRFQVTRSISGGLTMMDDAVHEYIGLAAYYLTGRIDEIFPGP